MSDEKQHSQNLLAAFDEAAGYNDLRVIMLLLRRFRWLYTVIFIITCSFGFWYLQSHQAYSSSVLFFYDDSPSRDGQEFSASPQANSPDPSVLLFYSDSVTTDLIQKFDLGVKFQNWEEDTVQKSKLFKNVSNMISLKTAQYNSFELHCTNTNRQLAAEMANEAVSKTTQLLNIYKMNQVEEELYLTEQLMKKKNNTDTSGEDQYLTALKKISGDVAAKLSGKYLDENDRWLGENLLYLINQIQNDYLSLKSREQTQRIIIEKLSSNKYPSLKVLRSALPDEKKYSVMNFFEALAIAIVSVLFLPVLLYIYLKIKSEWKSSSARIYPLHTETQKATEG